MTIKEAIDNMEFISKEAVRVWEAIYRISKRYPDDEEILEARQKASALEAYIDGVKGRFQESLGERVNPQDNIIGADEPYETKICAL